MHSKEVGFDELATFYKTIRIGQTNLSLETAEPGEMRWTGADFEGFTLDREWQSMTKTFKVRMTIWKLLHLFLAVFVSFQQHLILVFQCVADC